MPEIPPPDVKKLKHIARKLYGTDCTALVCGGNGGIRDGTREVFISEADDIKPRRVDDGYLVTITVFVPDEEA